MSDRGDVLTGMNYDELDLYIEDGEVLVSGPTEAALAYVEQLRGAGAEVTATPLSGRQAADLAAALAVAKGVHQASQGGVYLQVAKESLPHLAKNGMIPAKNGVHGFLGMTREGSKISHHLRFSGKTVNPAQLVNVQLIAVQLALRMAIQEVTQAIKRVEGKVDALLKLARADRAGNVLGLHELLSHHCAELDRTGVVTTADWQAIAPVGSQLSVTINQLRKHVSVSLADVVVSSPVNNRAEAVTALVETNRLDETLNLLVVMEDALFMFQRLRVAYVQRTEPEYLDAALNSARQLLADNARLDEELFAASFATLNEAASVRPLEIHRVFSVEKLERHSETMKGHLMEFAQARRLQGAEWQEKDRPGIADAANELGQRIQSTARRIDAAGDRAAERTWSRVGAFGETLGEVANRRMEKRSSEDDNTSATGLDKG